MSHSFKRVLMIRWRDDGDSANQAERRYRGAWRSWLRAQLLDEDGPEPQRRESDEAWIVRWLWAESWTRDAHGVQWARGSTPATDRQVAAWKRRMFKK